MLTKGVSVGIIIEHCSSAQTICGGIAQLARAFGSYPKCHRFKSSYRYHFYRVSLRLGGRSSAVVDDGSRRF